jgi:hypothetical protein
MLSYTLLSDDIFMPDTDMKLSSVASSAAHATVGLDIGGGISRAALGYPNSSLLLQASANTTHHDCQGANAAADKRWVGSLVCLATALTSASLMVWLALIIAG